jgi:DNA/RNA-binding domain of Phe-tRNA-synthetase-like protein
LDLQQLPDLPEIKGLRKAFRMTGKEPSRYRGSQESLLRRILQGKGLFEINTVVDINNLLSLESRHSVGTYDLAHISGPLIFRVGKLGETYQGIGKDPIEVAGLPVFADRDGPFGSPHRDSARAMVTLNTKEIVMVIISFAGSHGLKEFVQRAAELLCLYSQADRSTLRTAIL